jgi:hypothetical protein
VTHRLAGPAPRLSREPAIGSPAGQQAHHYKPDADVRRRRLLPAIPRTAPSRGHLEGGYDRYEHAHHPVRQTNVLRNLIEGHLLQIFAVLVLVSAVGWGVLFYSVYPSLSAAGPPPAMFHSLTSVANTSVGKTDLLGTSTYARVDRSEAVAGASANADTKSAASIVAREWSLFQSTPEASRDPAPTKAAEIVPPVRVAALESATPHIAALHRMPDVVVRRFPASTKAKTSLIDFETAPFPYHGNMPGSDHPFLNAGEEGHRGHVNSRGRIYWESETYSDDRVLLHIPAGFDPNRSAVMVVFFHGHGADLARDVRDRQRLPAQITASGANAVLVAPQFAFDAADSSAGKFWQPDGFKRFLDEAAQKLAKMYGDPRTARTFGTMPIVIVAYSGGFGPTLAVLDRGGASTRVRGLVLLDALYAGVGTFADWIAHNRSSFFVSAYTPHTKQHNVDLEHLLNERSVPFGSELKRNHLQGTVTFLPAGDVSHRDFVTHAWADNPVKDILVRLDDIDPKIETAGLAASKRD